MRLGRLSKINSLIHSLKKTKSNLPSVRSKDTTLIKSEGASKRRFSNKAHASLSENLRYTQLGNSIFSNKYMANN